MKDKFLALAAALVLLSFCSYGQLVAIDLGINGLTCSQCSRSVEIQLRKLPFIESIRMDLKNTTASIVPKQKATISWEAVAKAATDAGFSVRSLQATFEPEKLEFQNPSCFVYQSAAFSSAEPLGRKQGRLKVQLIAKEFLPKKEMGKYSPPPKGSCKGKSIYFVREI